MLMRPICGLVLALGLSIYGVPAAHAAPITSGLQLWLDAQDLDGDGNPANNPAGGTAVGTSGNNWINKAGTGPTHALHHSGVAPTYQPGVENGQAVVQFGAGTLRTSGIVTFGPFSYFTAFHSNAGTAIVHERSFNTNSTGNGEYLVTTVGNTVQVRRGGIVSGKNADSSTWGTGAYLVGEHFFDGTNAGNLLYRDGAAVPLTTTSGFAPGAGSISDILYIGGRSNNSLLLNGHIGEMLVYNRVLNAAERVITENYLASKYGLATTNDRYTGDVGGVDFDFDVFGVGNRSSDPLNPGSLTSATQGAYSLSATGLDDDDFIMAGFPATPGSLNEALFYLDGTNLDGNENITLAIDLNALGFAPAGYGLGYSASDPNSLALFAEGVLSGSTLNFQFNAFNDGFLGLMQVPLAPEPTSLALFGLAAAGLAGWTWHRRR